MEVKRYTEEKERLERSKEEIRGHLAQLRREKRELKETLLRCTGKGGALALRERTWIWLCLFFRFCLRLSLWIPGTVPTALAGL